MCTKYIIPAALCLKLGGSVWIVSHLEAAGKSLWTCFLFFFLLQNIISKDDLLLSFVQSAHIGVETASSHWAYVYIAAATSVSTCQTDAELMDSIWEVWSGLHVHWLQIRLWRCDVWSSLRSLAANQTDLSSVLTCLQSDLSSQPRLDTRLLFSDNFAWRHATGPRRSGSLLSARIGPGLTAWVLQDAGATPLRLRRRRRRRMMALKFERI